jgi:RHS repeat-associated protein
VRRSGSRTLPILVVKALVVGLLPAVVTAVAQAERADAAVSTSLISVKLNGTAANDSSVTDITPDGRYVVFRSGQGGIVSGVSGDQLYLRDRQSSTTSVVSVNSSGQAAGTGGTSGGSVSADGRYIAFGSGATNLVSGDTNGVADVFVRDRATGTTTRVSVGAAGAQSNGASDLPGITDDGRKVILRSSATNLVSGDTNGVADVFLHHLSSGVTTRVSVTSGGSQIASSSDNPSISGDGRFVAFDTQAQLDSDDLYEDVFIRDLTLETVSLASKNDPLTSSSLRGFDPSLSRDGRYVSFSALVSGDFQVYRYDQATETTERVSTTSSGALGNNDSQEPVISGDGRATVFKSSATNLISGDTNSQTDTFVRDLTQTTVERVSLSSTGAQASNASAGGVPSTDGQFVAFSSSAKLVPEDSITQYDAYLRDRDAQPLLIGGALDWKEGLGHCNEAQRSSSSARRQAADPIDVVTGNYAETFGDISIPGRGFPLKFARTYNSLAATVDGPLGYGWTHSYAASLSVSSGVATVRQECGAEVQFNEVSGVFTPSVPRTTATLVRNVDNSYTFVRNGQETLLFDSTGRLTGLKDRNNETTTVTYPSSTSMVITDPASRTLTFTLSSGRVTSVGDSSSPSRSVSFTYDGNGDLTEVVDAGGGHTTFTYDSSHRMLTKRRPKFHGDTTTTPTPVVTNHYDSSGRVDWQSDELGRTTSFDYTSVASSTKVTDPRGNAILYTYRDGVVVSETHGYGASGASTWSFGYDPSTMGVTSVTDPLGNVTYRSYDEWGNLLSEFDPLGRRTVHTYDADNDLLTTTDPSGATTTRTYNTAGNLTSVARPLVGTSSTQTTTYTYGDTNHPGDLTSVSDPLSKTSTFDYDTYGNLVSEIDPLGNETTHGYDSAGRRTSTVAPKGNVTGGNPSAYTTTRTFNAFGDVLTVTDPLSRVTTQTYDANRNLLTVTDAENHTTTYSYDAANQRISTTRPDTSVLETGYDAAGNVTAQEDGANQVTTYGYDAQNRLISQSDPLSRATTFGYDLAGRMTTITDPASQVTTRAYDTAGQLTGITYSDGTTPNVTFTYDTLGRRAAMADGTGTSSYSYDSLGRLTSHTNGANQTVGYGWDLRGQLTTLTYPGNLAVTRGYDDAGRWTSTTDWNSNTTTFDYDANSNLTGQTLPNSTSATRTFDAADQLTGISHDRGSTNLATFDYTRDDIGQLATVTSTGVGSNDTYTYTPINQLGSDTSGAYDYDAADNLTVLANGQHQGFDVANQLCWSTTSAPGGSPTCSTPPTGATTYTYDNRGNRTAATPSSGPATSYTYDQANRLTAYGANAVYAYDGDGLRASKTVSSATTAFTWNTAGGLPMLLVAGSTKYVYGPLGPLAQIGSTSRYFAQDQLGSTRILTDSAGNVEGAYDYDAYGRVSSTSGTATTALRFAGEQGDDESGLTYLRARYYDPSSGDFLNRDPIEHITRSPYAYVNGNPLNYSDPSGLAGASGTWEGPYCPAGGPGADHPGSPHTSLEVVGCYGTGAVDGSQDPDPRAQVTLFAIFGVDFTVGLDGVSNVRVGFGFGLYAGVGIPAADNPPPEADQFFLGVPGITGSVQRAKYPDACDYDDRYGPWEMGYNAGPSRPSVGGGFAHWWEL